MVAGDCPLCFGKADIADLSPNFDRVRINCPSCGHIEMPSPDLSIFRDIRERGLLPYLSAHTRQNSSRNSPIHIDSRSWEGPALLHSRTPVLRKIEKILKMAVDKGTLGSLICVAFNDYPLLDVCDNGELEMLLRYLEEAGFIERRWEEDPEGNQVKSNRFLVTVKGWERVETVNDTGIPGRCFVAMSFDDSLNEAWEKGIEPALRADCGMDPVRVDKREHNEKICDKIIAEIRMSQFLVADFTLHRQGVYFEAGFALGLGRPVIWMCREDEFTPEKVHFDTRQYNHIVWTTPEDLRAKLRNRVIATIPEAASQPFARQSSAGSPA
jgi:DNA-binding PadR family transcriptional regulator